MVKTLVRFVLTRFFAALPLLFVASAGAQVVAESQPGKVLSVEVTLTGEVVVITDSPGAVGGATWACPSQSGFWFILPSVPATEPGAPALPVYISMLLTAKATRDDIVVEASDATCNATAGVPFATRIRIQ